MNSHAINGHVSRAYSMTKFVYVDIETIPTRKTPSNVARAEWRASQSWQRWSDKRGKWWSKSRLSPAFVNWLMGWPRGHALLNCSEMAWCRFARLMRGELLRLPTASGQWIWKPQTETETPQQMDMFA